jgi:prepilin-type N-terminal cleavage/methylation domain-containing protein
MARRRGFTLVELGIVLVVVAAVVMLVLPMLTVGNGRGRTTQRQVRDSTHVRGVHQGLVMWAQNNQDRYPLPSLLDVKDATIAAPAESKDTTANIISILIYNGYFGPELCVSPAEANPAIRQMSDYVYSSPPKAADPANALWDPAFSADFTSQAGGHFSYGHMQFGHGARMGTWSNTFSATQAAVGNRGPKVTARDGKGWAYDTASNTLLIHGGRTTWEGNIAYNDNHVNFETRMDPEEIAFKAGGVTISDCLFFDEAEDPTGLNALLGLYTASGANPGAFTTIWD